MAMTGDECDQLALDNDWSLTRENACHLSVQNHEMGELRDEMILLSHDVSEKFISIEYHIENMQSLQSANLWIWGIIASTLIVMAIKRIFGKMEYKQKLT